MTLSHDVCFSCAAKLRCEVFGTDWNVCGIPLESPSSCSTFDRFRYNEVSRHFFLSFSHYCRKCYLIQKNTSVSNTIAQDLSLPKNSSFIPTRKTQEHGGVHKKSLKNLNKS